MTIRLKLLRKEMGMNQSEFGAAIGLKQRTISEIESGSANLTERNFNAICEKFNVNPNWLRNGEGEIFLPDTVETYIDKVVAKKNLSAEDKALIKSMIELPPEARKAFVDWAEKLVEEVYSPSTQQAKNDERRELEKTIADAQLRLAELDGRRLEDIPLHKMTPEQKRAVINRQLDLEEEALKKERASLASTITTISKKSSNTS